MKRFVILSTAFAAAFAIVLASRTGLCEEILVIEQDYDIIEQKGGGPEAKDVRQKLYIGADRMCIDEYGGKAGHERPIESTLIDFKARQIVTLKHPEQQKTTETFDSRREKIEARKKQIEDDLAAESNPETKKKVERLYRGLLDDKRQFSLAATEEVKTLAGYPCKKVQVLGDNTSDYVPLDSYFHPTLELPYDNAELLYLLEIIGPRLSQFLGEHKPTFKFVPMELHLTLSAGGRLDTRVICISKSDRASLDISSRGELGNPFEIPAYPEEVKRPVRKTPKKDSKNDPL